jgi:hypothetical protein
VSSGVELPNIKMHSNRLYIFARYHTLAAASNQVTTGGYEGSSLELGNSSEAVKTAMTHDMRSDSNKATVNKQDTNEGSNNDNIGSATMNVFTNHLAPEIEKVHYYVN